MSAIRRPFVAQLKRISGAVNEADSCWEEIRRHNKKNKSESLLLERSAAVTTRVSTGTPVFWSWEFSLYSRQEVPPVQFFLLPFFFF